MSRKTSRFKGKWFFTIATRNGKRRHNIECDEDFFGRIGKKKWPQLLEVVYIISLLLYKLQLGNDGR